MQKFETRMIPLDIWKEIVTFLQHPEFEHLRGHQLTYLVAKGLGYEISVLDAELASIRF